MNLRAYTHTHRHIDTQTDTDTDRHTDTHRQTHTQTDMYRWRTERLILMKQSVVNLVIHLSTHMTTSSYVLNLVIHLSITHDN